MASVAQACPSAADLRAFLDGALPNARFEQLAAHLLDCSECELACQALEDHVAVPVEGQPPPRMEIVAEFREALLGTLDRHEAADQGTLDLAGMAILKRPGDKDSRTEDEIPPGSMLGSYRVLSSIGAGGMGCVVSARHEMLGRLVAIKIPFRRISSSPEGQQRFLREARAASKLQHVNICPVHEVGEWQGRPYLVMAYVAGQTLANWRRERQPTAHESARIVAAMARGIAQAHAQGIIHRDLKPSNVLIEESTGRPILTDFGLARDASELDDSLTATGQLMGTPAYMAPEQAAGHTEAIGPASDIYGLGAVLYELLAQRPPYQGSVGDVIRAVQVDDPIPPRKIVRTIHRDLETICLRAMKRKPAERYPSAGALADDLERFCAGEAIWARPDTWLEKSGRFLKRRRGAILAGALVIALCAALVGYFANNAAETRQAAALAGQFESELQKADWNAATLERLNSLSTTLRERYPRHPSADPGRIASALSQYIDQGVLDRARLADADIVEARALIQLLESADASAATRLNKRLTDRLSEWRLVSKWGPFAEPLPVSLVREGAKASDLVLKSGALERPEETKSGTTSTYHTSVSVAGNVRFQVQFRDSWRAADKPGLVFATTGRHRYVFRLSPVNAPNEGEEEALVRGPFHTEECLLDIERDGVLLRRQKGSVPAGARPDQVLTLTATFVDRRLSFSLQNQASVEFVDFFLLPQEDGEFTLGLLIPPGAAVASLSVEQQAVPAQPSALERGDQLYAQRKWQEALVEYRNQQHALSVSAAEKDELWLKEALCLVALKQPEEATKLFNRLRGSSHDLVRRAAVCHLWLSYLLGDKNTEASVVFTEFQQNDLEDLARLIPEAERDVIAGKIFQTSSGLDMFYVSPEVLESLRRANLLRAAAWGGEQNEGMRMFQLARGFHAANEYVEGIRLLRPYLDSPRVHFKGINVDLFEEYVWMLRSSGDLPRSLTETQRQLAQIKSPADTFNRLLLERARHHAAAQRWKDCLADCDAFLQTPVAIDRYFYYSTAHLMRGFCLRRLGREAEVQAAWREAHCSRWRELSRLKPADLTLTGMPFTNALLAGIVSKQLPPQELKLLIQSSGLIKGNFVLQVMSAEFGEKLLPVLLRISDDPDALSEIERMVFQQVPLAEFMRRPVHLIGTEIFRNAAQVASWTPEERREIHKFWNGMIDAYGEHNLEFSHIANGLAAWGGKSTDKIGWVLLEPDLPPHLRGPLALVLGMKFLSRNQLFEAQHLLHVASLDLPPDSMLIPLLLVTQSKLLPDR